MPGLEWATGEGYAGLVLVATMVLLVVVRLRAEMVALLVLIALEVPGVVTREEALSGFSSSAVITIIGLFVLGAALERTGVADQMAGLMVRVGGRTESRLIAVVMLASAALSLVMNNIAAGAVIMPAAVTVARRVRLSPSKLLMPLAFGASLGGMATIFTTANILISNTLRSAGHQQLGFLDFLPIGSALILAGIVYMVLAGRRLLPDADPLAEMVPGQRLAEIYGLHDRLWEVQVPETSPLAGHTLAEAGIGQGRGVAVLGVFHGQVADLAPGPDTAIGAGDVLLVAGRETAVMALPGVAVGRETRAPSYFANPHVQLVEVVVAPRAEILGQTLKEVEFRRRYGATVVAIWQGARAYRTGVGDLRLHAGDALLAVGTPDRLTQLAADPAFIPVTPVPSALPRPHAGRRNVALAITALVLGLSAAQRLPTSIAVLLGFVLFVLGGCLTVDEAIASIEWKTVFVIAGMLPLSTAMQKTGLASAIGGTLVAAIGGHGFAVLAGGLYAGTVLLSQVLGGQVAALVMGPIAVEAATATGLSARSIGIMVAIACSSTFLTPLAHPVNLLVAGPGGYTFRDFARAGLGLTVVCLVVVLLGARILPSG